MSPDEQEALSRRYGNDIVILLPLRSGKVAVFNAARELCGFAHREDIGGLDGTFMSVVEKVWRAPALPLDNETYRTMASEDVDDLLREAGL